MRHLYVKHACPGVYPELSGDFLKDCQVEALRPRLCQLTLPGERLTRKAALGRAFFLLITGGKYRIFYLLRKGEIVHISYLVPKCIKFPFLRPGDYQIGPCMTGEPFRRKGVYRFMLQYITSLPGFAGADFYLIIRDTNTASIAGAESAGFARGEVVRKTRLLNYKLEK